MNKIINYFNNFEKFIFPLVFIFTLIFSCYPFLNRFKNNNNFLFFKDKVEKNLEREKLKQKEEIFSLIKSFSFLVGDLKENKVIIEKNSSIHLYPASITKLFLAMIVIDQLPLNQEIEISPYAVSAEGGEGGLKEGEKMKVLDLLKVLLITSSNDAAIALQEAIEKKGEDIIDLMNKKIKMLGLTQTAIFDPRGIDRKGNFSTSYDLFLLSQEIYKDYPLIGEITRKQEETVFSLDQENQHLLKNTNLLTGEIKEIWGGKTGSTPEAGDCLLTIYEFSCSIFNPQKEKKIPIAIIVLNSSDRFQDTKILYEFVKNNYLKEKCL